MSRTYALSLAIFGVAAGFYNGCDGKTVDASATPAPQRVEFEPSATSAFIAVAAPPETVSAATEITSAPATKRKLSGMQMMALYFAMNSMGAGKMKMDDSVRPMPGYAWPLNAPFRVRDAIDGIVGGVEADSCAKALGADVLGSVRLFNQAMKTQSKNPLFKIQPRRKNGEIFFTRADEKIIQSMLRANAKRLGLESMVAGVDLGVEQRTSAPDVTAQAALK